MWSFTKIVFITVGLYLVISNIYEMAATPASTNDTILRAVSAVIGGALLAYGFHVTPVTGLVNSIVGGVKDVVVDALKTTTKVVKDTTAAAAK